MIPKNLEKAIAEHIRDCCECCASKDDLKEAYLAHGGDPDLLDRAKNPPETIRFSNRYRETWHRGPVQIRIPTFGSIPIYADPTVPSDTFLVIRGGEPGQRTEPGAPPQ